MPKQATGMSLVLLLASSPLLGCLGDEPSLSTNERISFEEFKAQFPREPWSGGRYVIESDIALSEEELREYWENIEPGGLAVLNYGSDVKWNSTDKLNLTYCISDNFGVAKDIVTRTMERAAREWERRANVNFIHLSAYDASCTSSTNAVLFNVNLVDVGGAYAAAAFFPDASRAGRELNVNIHSLGSPYFPSSPAPGNSPAGLTGLFGHELGHILGFRHEHTRPEDGICFEDNNWRDLTAYDSKSIMHYTAGMGCAGTAAVQWWTEKDRIGAAALYGAGAAGFADILWSEVTNAKVWTMNGATVVAQGNSIASGSHWQIAGTGDFDADGKADVLWREDTSGQVYIWFMDGVTALSTTSLGYVGNDWVIIGVGDADGDGTSDIYWRNNDTTMRIWRIRNGAKFDELNPPSRSLTSSLKGIIDLDRDGIDDLVWTTNNVGASTVTLAVWIMQANGSRAETTVGTESISWQVQGVGDFDGDNHGDILWRNTNGSSAIWFMQGNTKKSGDGYPPSVETWWVVQGIGDFNGDWKADILWRDSGGATSIWFMDGATRASQGFPGSVGLQWTIKGVNRFN